MKIHAWSDYIIRKGLLLSCGLMTGALILSVWASAAPYAFPFLRRCAACFQSSSAVVLGAVLLGGLLLEDILCGES